MAPRPPDYFDQSRQSDDRLAHAKALDRSFSKQLFREMAKTEMEDAPLTGRQHRRYLSFAARLGIDDFEARLILRAVEYECGHAELAILDDRRQDSQAMSELVFDEGVGYDFRTDLVWMLLTGAVAIVLCGWLSRWLIAQP